MQGTFNVRDTKVRVASQRRYVLLAWNENAQPKPRWTVVKRSDTRAKLMPHIRERTDVILDTVTGEEVK